MTLRARSALLAARALPIRVGRVARAGLVGLVGLGGAFALSVLGACSSDSGAATPAAERGATERLREDPRIAWLLEPCAKYEHYDRDTSNLIPLLVGKLALSEPGPLQRCKEALVELGGEAVPELSRLMNRHFADKLGTPFVQNAVEVLSGIDAPAAREPVLRAFNHPSTSVRSAALVGLRKHHARPEDYDLFMQRLEVEALELLQGLGLALHDADPARAEAQYLEWIEAGEQDGIWRHVYPLLVHSDLEATRDTCRRIYADVRSDARPWLAAAAARAGDAGALEVLRTELRNDNPGLRTSAVRAAIAGGFPEELERILLEDPDPELRSLAAAAIGGQVALEGSGLSATTGLEGAGMERPELRPLAPGVEEHARELLLRAMDDPADRVRFGALVILARMGEPAAEDRILFLLGGSRELFAQGVAVLQQVLAHNSSLGSRALARLREREQAERHLPLAKRAAIYQAIGLVPGEDSARDLLAFERELEGEGEVQGMAVHRWMTLCAANTGPAGRRHLAEALRAETDPIRRIDLLWAVSSQRDELSRATLHAVLEDESTHPLERVFAAERLLNLERPGVMAPLLKRITLRVRDDAARVALQCMLWRWY